MRLELDRTLKILLTVVLAAVIGYFAWQVIQRVLYPIELFVMGAIVAFILSPLVDRLREYGFPRALAILAVYIMLLGALSLLGYLLVNPLLNQIQALVKGLPTQVAELQTRLNKLHLDEFLSKYQLPSTHSLASQASDYVKNLGQTVFDNLTTLLYTSFNFVVNLVLVLVIAFYLLLDGEQLKDRVYFLIPESQLSRVTFVEATINQVLGAYLRGQLLMSLTIGTMAGVGTAALGVQYPVVIGVLAGILELVPMLGPWLASMPAVLIALFAPHPWPLTLWVALYFLVIQQLESNVIGPRITGHAVGVHPLGALMALLVGIEVAGILGALFAVPVAGILYVFSMAIYYDLTGRPRPEPQVKALTPSLLGTLGSRVSWLNSRPMQSNAAMRFAALHLHRDQDLRPRPQRLEDVERARDKRLDELMDRRQQQITDSERTVLDVEQASVQEVRFRDIECAEIQAEEEVAAASAEPGRTPELPTAAR